MRANAGGGELVRVGGGARGGAAIHGAGAEGDVAAFPMHKGRHCWAAEGGVRGCGGERCGGGDGADQGGDAAAEGAGAEISAPEIPSAHGNA